MRAKVLLPALLIVSMLAAPVAAQPTTPPRQTVQARPAHQRIILTGFTRARAEMALISEVAGRCQSVAAEVGETIGADGVFARLDATFVRLELEANQVEQSRLRSRIAYLAKELGRTKSLVRKKSQAQAKLDAEEQELDQARHQLKALEVARRTLAERLERHVIAAPAGWRMMERKVEPGQWVGRGAMVGRAGDFRKLLVPLALTPEELAALTAMPRITLAAPGGQGGIGAVIERQSPAFDPATRKLNLDLAVTPQPGGPLSPGRGGLRLELELLVPDPAGAVLVPEAAVSERYQEHWLTRPDGERVGVVLLGPGPEGSVRVAAPGVEPGQNFVVPE